MIKSRADYIRYRKLDGTWKCGFKAYFRGGAFKFKVLLRKSEYFTNVKGGVVFKALAILYRRRLAWYGCKLGYTIPINVCGPGLSLPHVGTIVINGKARIGMHCRIHVCVNIGASGGVDAAPVVGDGVYIAPGAKLFGDIMIADRVAIGANAVVNRSFQEAGVTVGGVPAKVLGDGGAVSAGWCPLIEN